MGLGQVCADRTPEKATLRKILELLPQGKDRGPSYMETILPLEGPSIVGTLMALPCFSANSEKKILETDDHVLIITEKMNQEAIRSQKCF